MPGDPNSALSGDRPHAECSLTSFGLDPTMVRMRDRDGWPKAWVWIMAFGALELSGCGDDVAGHWDGGSGVVDAPAERGASDATDAAAEPAGRDLAAELVEAGDDGRGAIDAPFKLDGGDAAGAGSVLPGLDATDAIRRAGPVAQWARTVAAPTGASVFGAVVPDRAGNVYVTGDLWGKDTFDFGGGVTATGLNDRYSALLVKYDASGTPRWATANRADSFGRLALDSAGNVYVLARLPSTSEGGIDFGHGVTVSQSDTGSGVVLVKYSADGAALWAKVLAAGAGLALDADNNIYVAGTVADPVAYDAAANVSTGEGRNGRIKSPAPQPVDPAHALLAKYDASGALAWTRTVAASAVTGDSPHSTFGQLAVDAAGNIYVTGTTGSDLGHGNYDFGNGATAVGPCPVLVKYDATGATQWVQPWPYRTYLNKLAVDAAGNVYGAGQMICATLDFGNGVTVTSSGGFAGTAGPSCAILVKHGPSGLPQWAASNTGNGTGAYFDSVALDSAGNVYAAGSVYGEGTYDFGNGAIVAVPGQSQNYLLLAKYTASGTPQWARSSDHRGSSYDELSSVAIDGTDNIYVAGVIAGPGDVDFGDGVALSGLPQIPNGGWNALLAKYR